MYLGLSRENALECFDIEKKYPAPLTPKTLYDENGIKYEAIIDESVTTSFSVRSITFDGGEFILDKGAAVYVVTEGCGTVTGENYSCEIKKGDYFLMPDAAKDKFVLSGKNMKIIECYV